jgi:glycosyltransferase involved in cell wall biosynthesis
VIVADDFSPDTTISVARETLGDRVKNLRILESTRNQGIAKNYQRGFSACTGEYIAVIEGDDYWTDPNRLIKHIDFLDKHNECVMTMNKFMVYRQDLCEFSNRVRDFSGGYRYVNTRQMAKGNKLGNLSACVFRKGEIDKIEPDLFDLEIADWIIGMVLSRNGYIAVLDEVMSVYRIHNNGHWTKMTTKQQVDKTIILIDKYNQYLEYKYDKEFCRYKKKLNKSIKETLSKFSIFSFIHPPIKHALKLIFPKVFIRYIKRIFIKGE